MVKFNSKRSHKILERLESHEENSQNFREIRII